MKKTFTITLSTNKHSVVFGDGGQYKILSFSGFDAADFSVAMQSSGYLDGGYITKSRIDSRTLNLTFHIKGSDSEEKRSTILQLFTPHSDVTVTVNRCGVVRKIDGKISVASIAEENLYAPSTGTIQILCPDPYWRDISDYGKNVAEVKPLLYLPNAIPQGYGLTASIRTVSDNVILSNAGDVPCGIVARFIMTGTVTNPSIINQSTGQYIRIIDTFVNGDIVEISAVPRNKTVTKNGVNHIQKTDRASVFSDFLPIGDNIIRYDADDGYNNMDVYLYYTPLYLGV